jgi:uncharacterized protein
MDDNVERYEIEISDKRSLVLSSPGTLLTRMTTDVLPLAHNKRDRDDEVASPLYEKARLAYLEGDFTAAVDGYLAAAEMGHREAQFQLAEMYLNGQGVMKDYKETFDWFHRAADQGDANAQNRLGWMSESGLGTEMNQIRAVNWFRMAAERGHLEAQFNLGAKYDNGEGVVQNYAEAARWYRLSAEQGLSDARFFLAQALEAGEGVPEDCQEAIDWYILAVEQGHRSAEIRLWTHVLGERYLPEDDEEKLFIERLGAKMGHPLAQFKLGYRLDVGDGVEKNLLQARCLYEKSANQGSLLGAAFLSLMYVYGRGVPKDDALACKWRSRARQARDLFSEPRWMIFDTIDAPLGKITELRKTRIAADSGDLSAMSLLAQIYYFGQGTLVDYSKAFEWCRKAAKADSAYPHYLLACMYENGEGVRKSLKQAKNHFRISAILQPDLSACRLAELYKEEWEDHQKSTEVVQLLMRAAEDGSKSAQFKLGYLFSEGENVPLDHARSTYYYELAAEQGSVSAFFNLAYMLRYGEGADVDVNQAVEFYEAAAEGGMIRACEQLHQIYLDGELVPQDLELAEHWKNETTRLQREMETSDNQHIATDPLLLPTGVQGARRERLAEKRSLQKKARDFLC